MTAVCPTPRSAASERRIREALVGDLSEVLLHETDTIVLQELVVALGEARIDVVVANGALHGYEIKSDYDSLERLPGQTAVFSRVFDEMTLVCGRRWAKSAEAAVPRWWEIVIAEEVQGEFVLRQVRPGGRNPSPDSFAVASLLWKQEAIDLLPLNWRSRLRSKPRRMAWEALAQLLSAAELSAAVAVAFRARVGWRADAPRT